MIGGRPKPALGPAAVVPFSKPMQASHPKTSAVYENLEVRKGRGLVLTMLGLSKTVGSERRYALNVALLQHLSYNFSV